jgi:hypothetical protein
LAGSVFQVLNLAQGRLILGLADDGFLRVDAQLARSDGLAQGVGGPAGVSAGVFRVRVHNVQGDKAEAVGLHEAGAGLERHVVLEPLDPHGGIRDGNQTALEMGPLAFLDLDRFQRRRKDRRLY